MGGIERSGFCRLPIPQPISRRRLSSTSLPSHQVLRGLPFSVYALYHCDCATAHQFKALLPEKKRTLVMSSDTFGDLSSVLSTPRPSIPKHRPQSVAPNTSASSYELPGYKSTVYICVIFNFYTATCRPEAHGSRLPCICHIGPSDEP